MTDKADAKQLVLFAIYAEYQKDLPCMHEITPTGVGLDADVFNVAVMKLQNEGFITGAVSVTVDQSPYPVRVVLNDVQPTREGIAFAEAKLGLDAGLTGKEKAQRLAEKFASWGLEALANFAASVVADIVHKVR